MIFAVITLSTLALWAAAAIGMGLALYNLVLDTWQLPKFAGICHSLAALAIVKTIRQARSLVDTVMPGGVPDEAALLRLFEANFYHQIGKRLNGMEDRGKIVRAVLDHAEAKAAILAALAPPKL